jgi:TolB-like protein/Tfp pilus assembly protein PilF
MQSKLIKNKSLQVNAKKDVLNQLNHILSSDLFTRSNVLSSFLKFIVEETVNGNTSDLKEYTIAVNGLGRSDDFNPQIDAIVRIHAGRLRRLLNEYYMGPGKTDLVKIEVVKGTYVPVFRANAINKTNEIVTEIQKPIQHSRTRITIAVLPFRNLCSDGEYQFFVDGFGEELTRIFSTNKDVAVIAHHSTRKYAINHEDVRIIGANLGAHYLINGSVKRSNTKIQISVGLIESLNGTLIWSKKYTHLLDKEEFIDIQDQINNDVFSILSGHYGFITRDTMSGLQDAMKQNLVGFDAILWNYHAQMTHSLEACSLSREALEKALEEDSDNIMCLVMLGDLYLNLHLLGYPNIEDPVNEACRLIKKAIKLAPLSQNAYLAYGWANVCLGKQEEAIKALNHCIELAPLSASTSGDIGFSLICAGEYKRSYALLQQSLDLNPYCPWWYYMGFFFVHYQNENYEKALQAAQKMNASEDVFLDPLLMAAAKGQLGLISEAKEEIQLLNEKFQPILADININLESFVLDRNLIDNIVKGVKLAGLKTS